MGYLDRMYGKQPEKFIWGVLTGIQFYSDLIGAKECFGGIEDIKDAMQEAVDDLAKCPENFNVKKIIERGYV